MAELFKQFIGFVFTIDFYLKNLRLLHNTKMNINF